MQPVLHMSLGSSGKRRVNGKSKIVNREFEKPLALGNVPDHKRMADHTSSRRTPRKSLRSLRLKRVLNAEAAEKDAEIAEMIRIIQGFSKLPIILKRLRRGRSAWKKISAADKRR